MMKKGLSTETYIDELPIGKWSQPYEKDLEKMCVAKKASDYKRVSEAQWELYNFSEPSIKSLKLQKSYGLNNMVYLDGEKYKLMPKGIIMPVFSYFIGI